MKKQIFLFAIALLSSLQVMGEVVNWTPVKTTEMNPFAYNLKAELSNDKRNITISYCLNATAASVNIVFYNGENVYKTVPCSGLSKTTAADPYATTGHTITIPTTDLPINTNLSWRIEVQGPGRANCGVYSQDGTNVYRHKFYRPSSVDIVQDPTSFNYGKVLVVESQHTVSSKTGYHSSSKEKTKGTAAGNTDPQGAGIYVFNPDLTPRENTSGTYVFNGKSDSRFANTSYSPHRVRVSEDGRMFVTSMDHTKGAILWEINDYFSTWTTVMGADVGGATYSTSTYDLTTSGGSFIAGPNAGFDVKGSGSELTLLMLSCDYTAINANNQTGFECREYKLGAATTWSSAAGKNFNTNSRIFVDHCNSNVQYDENGGIWCISYRENCINNEPGLVHKTSAGTEDCRILRSNTKNAALRFNKTFTRAMMASEGNYGVLYDYIPDHGSNNASQGYFFSQRNIDMSAVGAFLNDFAWDNANNIYAVGQNDGIDGGNGHLAVYCLPYSASDVFTTPGPSSFILAETICWHPYPEGYEVTNEDLWETFQSDYNDWYMYHKSATQKVNTKKAHQSITNAYSFTFPSDKTPQGGYEHPNGLVSDFLTNNVSKWKWLGDYIKEVANPTTVPESNEALWEEFKPYFNTYLKLNRSDMTIDNVATFLATSDNAKAVLTNNDSKYKWLGDYIIKTANEQEQTITQYWHYVLHGFLKKVKEGGVTNSQGTLIKYNIDFSEAGEPENWLPYYVSSDGKSPISTEMEWRKEVHAFFNQTNKCGYTDINGTWSSDNTGDYTTAGQSDQEHDGANGWWNEWWDATFKPTLKAYPTDSLPTIRRKGYVLSGWFYGDNDGYSLDDKETTKGVTSNGCLWARWLETCLYEGYITGSVANSAATEEMGKPINRNLELIDSIHGKSDYSLDIVRKLQGGTYNTFVVPFAISKYPGKSNHIEKIVDVDNENIQLLTGNTSILRYGGSEIVENGVGEYVLQLNFEEWDGTQDDTDYIAASTPILIKPENDITARMHLKWNPFISTAYLPKPDDVTFTPVLAPSEVQGGAGTNNLILVADNRLARLSSTGTMLGLRGYFNGSQIPDNLAPQQMIIKITEKDGVVTYLDNIESPQQGAAAIKILQNGNIYILREGKVYDIIGRALREL